jgi:hypothetical protein
MFAKAIRDRQYHAFLSHAHADKALVDRLHDLLVRCAGIPVWYDATSLQASTTIATELPECIAQCRSMILVLSRSSIDSGWVKEEYSFAVGQRTRHHGFKIIPVRLDDCPVPGFVETTKWVDVAGGAIDVRAFDQLLRSFYPQDVSLDLDNTRDVYVSRSWRESETSLADKVSRTLVEAGFRLVGDAEDQLGFEGGHRVSSIMSSCGGFVAIVPDRGAGSTSKYILTEIEIASDKSLPGVIVAEPTVQLGETFGLPVVRMTAQDSPRDVPAFTATLEDLRENWRKPEVPHYVFFATDFDKTKQSRNEAVKSLVQSVTAMPCVMGEDIRGEHIQRHIKERITRAFVMIADISEDNLNTCIEAGIARGAGTRLHLIAREPRRRPPFMFRDLQVFAYGDDVELLGVVHRVLYPYRRRIINYET